MSALLELIVAFAAFILEATVQALVFLFLVVRAIFSRSYRQNLREHWNSSGWQRFSIVAGIGMYSALAGVALFFWIPFLSKGDRRQGDSGRSDAIEFSPEEMEKLEETEGIGELVKTTADLIKKKLADLRTVRAGSSSVRRINDKPR